MRRKSLVFIVVLALMVSFSCLIASAADVNATFSSANNVKAGDTVSITLTFSSSEELAVFGYKDLTYDNAVMSLQDDIVVANISTHQAVKPTAKNGAYASTENAPIDGNQFTFTFKILDNAKAGEYKISAAATSLKRTSEGDINLDVNVNQGTITVVAAPCEHEWNEGEVTKEATCTEAGVKTFTCSKCGEPKTEEIPALGHKFGEWTVVKEATETEKGLKERVCSVCGEKETEEIPVKTTEKDNGGSKDNGGKGNTTTTTQPPKTTTPSNGGSIPKTGDAGVSLAVAGVIAAMSMAGVAIIMKKRNDD